MVLRCVLDFQMELGRHQLPACCHFFPMTAGVKSSFGLSIPPPQEGVCPLQSGQLETFFFFLDQLFGSQVPVGDVGLGFLGLLLGAELSGSPGVSPL